MPSSSLIEMDGTTTVKVATNHHTNNTNIIHPDTSRHTVANGRNHLVDALTHHPNNHEPPPVVLLQKRHILAFGSCNDPYQQNALWPTIQAHQPTAFIWCGDAIYADKPPSTASRTTTTPSNSCATPDVFDRDYPQQLSVPGYQALMALSSVGENHSSPSSSSSSRDASSSVSVPVSSSHSDTYIPPHVFGTLDDHDYGCNNADRTYPYKYESGLAFLNFLNASSSSTSFSTSSSMMYQRGLRGEGIYGVQLYDFAQPKGPLRVIPDVDAKIDADLQQRRRHAAADVSNQNDTTSHHHQSTYNSYYTYSNQTVAVFVLDVRTHKTPWKTHWYERFFQKDWDGDLLGPQQWEWLQQSVQNSQSAHLHVFVSGIQFHPYRYPDGNIAESWSQYPRAQQQLYNIILNANHNSNNSTSKRNTPSILVSGDVHMTQLLQKDCLPYHTVITSPNHDHHFNSAEPTSLPVRRLIEMTTSGMTHSWGTLAVPLNTSSSSSTPSASYRHSYLDVYISYLSQWMIHLLHYTCPWTDIISLPASSSTQRHIKNNATPATTAKVGLQYSLEQNFGEIEIDFQQELIHLRTIGINAQPLLQMQYTFDELSSSSNQDKTDQPPTSYLSMKDFQNEIRSNPQLYQHIGKDDPTQWVCINHRGRDTSFQLVTGYMTSIALLTLLAPLPILVPPASCIIFVLLLLRLLRRCRDSTTHKRKFGITRTTNDYVLQRQLRVLFSTRATTTKPPIVFRQPTTRTTISKLWRFTWMPTYIPESNDGKKSFFPSSEMMTHHHYKKY